MLHTLAQRNGTTVDEVPTRELEDVACSRAEALPVLLPGFDAAMAWP
jgi:hypothetical protein